MYINVFTKTVSELSEVESVFFRKTNYLPLYCTGSKEIGRCKLLGSWKRPDPVLGSAKNRSSSSVGSFTLHPLFLVIFLQHLIYLRRTTNDVPVLSQPVLWGWA